MLTIESNTCNNKFSIKALVHCFLNYIFVVEAAWRSVFVVQIGIGAASHFVYLPLLEQLINRLEDGILGEEVFELSGHCLVDLVEVHALARFALIVLQQLGDELF